MRPTRREERPGTGNVPCTGHGMEGRSAGTWMLDAYVIEEIKRRERGKEREERPSLDLPLPPPGPAADRDHDEEDRGDQDRGVVIIDYSG